MRKVLALTNLFPNSLEPTRATYNREIFTRLACVVDLTLLVPISFLIFLKNPRLLKVLFSKDPHFAFAHYFVYFHLPGYLIRLNSLLMVLCVALQHPRVVFRLPFDVCFGSWLYPDADALRMISRLKKIALVTMALGTDVNAGLFRPVTRAGTLRVLNAARTNILVSNSLKETVIAEGVSRETTEVIYTGVDRQKFKILPRQAAREQLELSQNDKIVLFVGSLITTKGCFELVNAIAQIDKDRTMDIRLFIVGHGEQRPQLVEAVQALGISQCVMFVGTVIPEELGVWYAAADCFCLPSYREGVPNVVLEALACGIPVVATNVGGIPEILQDACGALIQPQNTSELVGAIRRTLARDFNHEAIASSVSAFNWDDTVSKIIQCLNDAKVIPNGLSKG